MLSTTVSLFAQRTVEGTITDAKSGETLIGVTVQIKGTTAGTIPTSMANTAWHRISLLRSSVLVYSYIGYTKIEQVAGQPHSD